MSFTTPDLCDAIGDAVRVAEPVFRDYGGVRRFTGRAATLRVHEDNALVRRVLESPGEGRVLVVDGGGSLRTALVGGQIAALAARNGWSGLVIYGGVRDSAELADAAVGIKALGLTPRRSGKTGKGEEGVVVTVGGMSVRPGDVVWGDEDGLIAADREP